MPSYIKWIGICFCISQSAMFSGLNLAVFSINRHRLKIEVSLGNSNAKKVLRLRRDANFVLTTILWGNVGINVLLTLLSESVLAGVAAFFFSTVIITFVGEILPQAYFSRNALRMAATLAPVLQFYQILLYPVAKPVAKVLDLWLGPEGVHYYREHEFRELIKMHIVEKKAEMGNLEGTGAINFLDLDDLSVAQEGEPVDQSSIIVLPRTDGMPIFPSITPSSSDPLLKKIHNAGKKWVVLVDPSAEPYGVINTDDFIRARFFDHTAFNPLDHWHRPVIIPDAAHNLGSAVAAMKKKDMTEGDECIRRDIILVWGSDKRVITGADILGRLLRGIA
jgi:metal transporter CNNM